MVQRPPGIRTAIPWVISPGAHIQLASEGARMARGVGPTDERFCYAAAGFLTSRDTVLPPGRLNFSLPEVAPSADFDSPPEDPNLPEGVSKSSDCPSRSGLAVDALH